MAGSSMAPCSENDAQRLFVPTPPGEPAPGRWGRGGQSRRRQRLAQHDSAAVSARTRTPGISEDHHLARVDLPLLTRQTQSR